MKTNPFAVMCRDTEVMCETRTGLAICEDCGIDSLEDVIDRLTANHVKHLHGKNIKISLNSFRNTDGARWFN